MKFIISKEMIEEQLGIEISYLKLEPMYRLEDNECIGLKVFAYPVTSVKEVEVSFTINTSLDKLN